MNECFSGSHGYCIFWHERPEAVTEQRVFFCGGWTIATGETEADRQCAQEAMNGTENRANKKGSFPLLYGRVGRGHLANSRRWVFLFFFSVRALSSFAHSCDFFVCNISLVSVHKKGKKRKKKIEGVSKYRFESLYYCECYKVNLSGIDRVCCEDNVAIVFGIL